MPAIDRWRTWRPADQKFEQSPRIDPTKLTKPPSVSSVSSFPRETQNFSAAPPEDPEVGSEDFRKWAINRCRFQDRRFSTIAGLFEDFCEWAAEHSVPCSGETFEQLLRDAGFLIADGWVCGLCLARWLTAEERKLSDPPCCNRHC